MHTIQTSKPARLPITLQEVKQQIEIDNDDSDVLLTSYMESAVSQAEVFTGQSFINRQYAFTWDFVPYLSSANLENTAYVLSRAIPSVNNLFWESLELTRTPLVSVDSITYMDRSQPERQTWPESHYFVERNTNGYARIFPRDSYSWPTQLSDGESITVNATCGMGNVPGECSCRYKACSVGDDSTFI